MIELVQTKKSDPRLRECMQSHYSKPKGFVGRSICYAVIVDEIYYGHIVGGSATKFLPNRNDFFGITQQQLNSIVNNIFFHIFRVDKKYPYRNFTKKVLKQFRTRISDDWKTKYGDEVIGFESLVQIPLTGEIYKRDHWKLIGQTKGYTCKRVGGNGTDSWSGKRVWDTKNLKPKLVFAKKVSNEQHT